MMLKFFASFIVFLCITALSCRKLDGFPILKSQDFNLSESAVQRHDIHDAGLNWTVSSESEAKGDDKDEYSEKYHKIFQSNKSKGGKGANGGANIPHRPSKEKNAAPSLVGPPCFLLTFTLHVMFTVILSFPALLLKLF